jgi:hypothetical protein
MLSLTREKWLSELKAGDQVVYVQFLVPPALREVVHATATQLVLAWPSNPRSQQRFRRADGYLMGRQSAYAGGRVRLEPPTPEWLDKIDQAALLRKIEAFPWGKLTVEQLRAINALLPVPPATDNGVTNYENPRS